MKTIYQLNYEIEKAAAFCGISDKDFCLMDIGNGIGEGDDYQNIKENTIMNQTIGTTTTAEREELNLTWTQIGTSEDTLSDVLSDCGILHAEPQSYPLTDGITLYIIDRNGKPRLLDISIAEGLIFDPEFNDIPLVVRLSSPIEAAE